MTIDIDSFLDKYKDENLNKEKEKQENQENFKLSIDLEKEVDKELSNFKKTAQDKKDLEIITKIYSEIKNFDSLIPNRFLNIDKNVNTSLKLLSDKYSKEFKDKVNNNLNILKNQILSLLKDFDTSVEKENYTAALNIFETLILNLNKFPREYLNEKISLSKEIRKRELILDNAITKYKKESLSNLKSRIKNSILNLKKLLVPGNAVLIEEKINEIHNLSNNIPRYLRVELLEEKKMLTSIILEAESFLISDYQIIFQNKENKINNLINVMHQYSQAMNVVGAVTTYNQIIIEFEALPEVFFERKMEIFMKLNDLFDSINSLILKGNLRMILDTYDNSKIIETVTSYLEHIKKTKQVDFKVLQNYKQEIEKLPRSLEIEKQSMLADINSILLHFKNFNSTKEKNPNDNDSMNFKVNSNINSKGFNPQILKEIELYFKRLKDSKNLEEVKLIHKKLIFYINLTPFSKVKRQELILEINKVIKNKVYN